MQKPKKLYELPFGSDEPSIDWKEHSCGKGCQYSFHSSLLHAVPRYFAVSPTLKYKR